MLYFFLDPVRNYYIILERLASLEILFSVLGRLVFLTGLTVKSATAIFVKRAIGIIS